MQDIKKIVLVVHVTLVKTNIILKLDGMDIIIQLKVKNHQSTFSTIWTTVFDGLIFQLIQRMLRLGKT